MTHTNDAAGGREWNPYELATPIARGPAADAVPPPLARTPEIGLNGLPTRRVDVADDMPELAALGTRALAALIDNALWMLPLLMVWNTVANAYRLITLGLDPSPGVLVAKAGIALAVWAVLAVWNIVWLIQHGQTIGKRVVGIRILRTDGSRVSPLRVLVLRSLVVGFLYMLIGLVSGVLALLFLAGAFLMIFGQARQCLHDRIADTQVFRV